MKESLEEDKYELDMSCSYCIELNVVPTQGDKCIFSDKLCCRHEDLKSIYGDDWEAHIS